jgi:uncharacterized protein (TIGR03437 family)
MTFMRRAVLLSLLVTFGLLKAQTISITNSASYIPVVSPDSLATVFGSNFTDRLLTATIGPDGRLPTEIGGVRVEIGGIQAQLFYVAANQINCYLPSNITPGDHVMEVLSVTRGILGRGTARVRATAPGMFSSSATGSGPGAILNAVTFTREPFEVTTQANAAADKRTRLALYGTGVRWAGNLTRSAKFTNAAAAVRVEAQDGNGVIRDLTVEYAGAAPLFLGLDQINVVLPESLEGAGVVALRVFAESSVSNTVTVLVRTVRPPEIYGVSPSAGPPGALITVSGIRFAAPQDGTVRTIVEIVTPDGRRMPAVPLETEPGRISLLLPPIGVSTTTWYQGPVDVCVTVDGRSICRNRALQIAAAAQPSLPVGETVAKTGEEVSRAVTNVLSANGESAMAAHVNRVSQANLAQFREMVREARAGRPPTIRVQRPDGSTVEAQFDLAALQQVESVLTAAGASRPMIGTPPLKTAVRWATEDPCGSARERELWKMRNDHESLDETLKWLGRTQFAAGMITIGLACTAGLAACLPAVPAISLTFAILFKSVAYAPFTAKILIEAKPSMLFSLAARPPTANLGAGVERTVEIDGQFAAKTGTAITREYFVRILEDVVFISLGDALAKVGLGQLFGHIVGMVADQLYQEFMPDMAQITTSAPQWVRLSSGSVKVSADRERAIAQVTLRCGEKAGSIRGVNNGTGTFTLQDDSERVLRFIGKYDGPRILTVAVGSDPKPTLSMSRQRYGPGEVPLITGLRFPAARTVQITIFMSGSAIRSPETLTTDRSGSFSAPLAIPAQPARYEVRAQAEGMEGFITTTFETSAQAVADEPGVVWAGSDSSHYKTGDNMVIFIRTARGSAPAGKSYSLMLELTSEQSGDRYYFYDNPNDTNRWLHTTARPMWSGVPEDRDFTVPGAGQPRIAIDNSTPAGRFVLRAYFMDPATNRQVGATGQGGFVVATNSDQSCAIATAAFGSPLEPAVVLLRTFRDTQLVHWPGGAAFVQIYYLYSPQVARTIASQKILRLSARVILLPVVFVVWISVVFHPALAGFFVIGATAGGIRVIRVYWLKRQRSVRAGTSG